jgi:SOS-response transcriptional repressor LexA
VHLIGLFTVAFVLVDMKTRKEYNSGKQMREEILAFVRRYITQHQIPPSLLDISVQLDISKTNARYHLQQLAIEGKIERLPHISRGIRIKDARG